MNRIRRLQRERLRPRSRTRQRDTVQAPRGQASIPPRRGHWQLRTLSAVVGSANIIGPAVGCVRCQRPDFYLHQYLHQQIPKMTRSTTRKLVQIDAQLVQVPCISTVET